MEAIPRNDGEQYRFDAFCKAVLRNEARNYHRNKKRLLDREKSFSVLSLEELGQLTSVDHYPSEEFVFSSYGCDLHIDNELVANAFAALSKQEQSIATVYKGDIIKNLIMDCQSYTKYRPNETTGGIFVSWRRKEELPTGA